MTEYAGTDNLEIMAEAKNYNKFLQRLIQKQITPRMRVLDIGAGIGTFALMLRNEGYVVTCFEPDTEQAGLIRSTGLEVVSDLDELHHESFDFIYSLNVLEHIEDDKNALLQWLCLLKPGGRLLVYVPAFQVLYSSMDKKVGHFRRYTKKILSDIVNKSNGWVIYSSYVDSLGFFASFLYKYKNDGTGSINRHALLIYDRIVFPISRVVDVLIAGLFGKNIYIVAGKKSEHS